MADSSESGGPAARPKRRSLAWTDVDAITEGLPRHPKSSFLIVGHRSGVRLAIPRTVSGVSRAYFYGPYELVPPVEGIVVHTPEARKSGRKGGIVAEVDFELDPDVARGALCALIEVVRAAPPPPPRGTRQPKAPKRAKPDPTVPEEDGPEGIAAGRGE